MSTICKRVLVYGGNGALGDALVSHLKSKNYWIVSVDMRENQKADANILVNSSESPSEQETRISQSLQPLLSNGKLDAILTVAGGWAGGNAVAEKFLDNAELMFKQSVNSSLIAAALAAKHLAESGVLTLTGAAAATGPTPGMIGYGMAKAAVHHLTKSLAAENSGMPSGAFVAAVLPITLDTPMNRKWMPKADHSSWTPLSFIAELFEGWISETSKRPVSGTLVKLSTANNETKLEMH